MADLISCVRKSSGVGDPLFVVCWSLKELRFRQLWGGGLTPIEHCFEVVIELKYAQRQAAMRLLVEEMEQPTAVYSSSALSGDAGLVGGQVQAGDDRDDDQSHQHKAQKKKKKHASKEKSRQRAAPPPTAAILAPQPPSHLLRENKGGAVHLHLDSDSLARLQGVFEGVLEDPRARRLPFIWVAYIRMQLLHGHRLARAGTAKARAKDSARDSADPLTIGNDAAKRLFFRAIQACAWSKQVWMEALGPLRAAFVSPDHLDRLVARWDEGRESREVVRNRGGDDDHDDHDDDDDDEGEAMKELQGMIDVMEERGILMRAVHD